MDSKPYSGVESDYDRLASVLDPYVERIVSSVVPQVSDLAKVVCLGPVGFETER